MRKFSRSLSILIPLLLPVAAGAALNDTLSFEPNRGQTDASVQYLARTPHGVVFFTDRQMVLYRPGAGDRTVRFELAGASEGAQWEPENPTGESISYYVGRDPKAWVEKLPRYQRLVRRGAYPGTDAIYYGSAGRLEYDFVLAPYADPGRIRIHVTGADAVKIGADGDLIVETPQGEIRQHRPVLSQTGPDGARRELAGGFRMTGRDEIGFTVGQYDPSQTLAIDPVLESATYLGGSLDDSVIAANAFAVVGMTTSIDFPGGGIGRRRGNDVFVMVTGSSPTTMILGGSGDDQVTSAWIGSDGSVLVGGYTDSKDLPTAMPDSYWRRTMPAWQADFAGGATDGFLFYISRGFGSMFVSYVGTPGDDRITGIGSYYTYADFAIVGTTTGRGLPLPSYTYGDTSPKQLGPGGGVDGFLILADPVSNNWMELDRVAYFGGSGDDRPQGVTIGDRGYYVTGETASTDFPLMDPSTSNRSGGSDAFVALISKDADKIWARLIGGSGTDRGVQVALTRNAAVVAGVTSSADLPLKSPIQATYGGGSSDIFIASFAPDLSQVLSTTYYGGSGTDEVTTAATSTLGDVYVGGWTNSTNFPLKNGLQSKFGGGPDDGFLLHFDVDNTLDYATYFGGAGSDRVLGLAAGSDYTAWLSGRTTSPDLPLKNATQSVLRGPGDGFVAQISTNLLNVWRLMGAKDLRASSSILVGRSSGTQGGTVTVTSSDPGSVLLAANSGDAGTKSVTYAIPTARSGSTYLSLYVDCMVDHGGADVTVALPGYASKVVHADCYPATLQIAGTTTPGVWDYPTYLTVYPVAVNPSNPSDWTNVFPRPSAGAIAVQVSNSNNAVGTVTPSAFNITANNGGSVSFQPIAVGTTTVTFTAAKPSMSVSVPMIVKSPITTTTAISVPKGFQRQMWVPVSGGLLGTVTVTSQDPSKLLLSTDPAQPGTAKLTFNGHLSTVYVQALASGSDVGVTTSAAGFNSVTTTIHLTAPAVYCSSCTKPLTLGLGESTYLSFTIGSDASALYWPNPGSAPYHFSLDSSVPSVATAKPASADLTNPNDSVSFPVVGLAAGTSKLTIHAPAGVPLSSAVPNAVQVTVQQKLLKMADGEVGKDLVALMSLVLPYIPNNSAQATFTTSDPSSVLLSLAPGAAGQTAISEPAKSNTLYFYVQGLKASGRAKVTATVPGFGSVSANVTLDPSGFGWDSDSFSSVLNGPSSFNSTSLSAFALDAVTLAPIAAQSLRPGVSATIAFASSNASVATASSVMMTPGSSSASVPLTLKSTGQTVLSLQAVPNFSTPALLQKMAVTVQRPSLTVVGQAIAKDTQVGITIGGVFSGNTGTLTVTSSDPSRLVLSADSTKLGAASIKVPLSSSGVIYAQALKNQGTVTISASADGFNPGSATFRLVDLGIGMSVNSSYGSGSTIVDGVASTTTQSPNTQLVLSFYRVDPAATQDSGYSGMLRPGAALPQVLVKSSNTAVGTILRSPATMSTNWQGATVDFHPVGAGDTDVTLVQPSGYAAPRGATSIHFHVTAPSFTAQNLVVSKDTMVSLRIAIPDNVNAPSSNLAVTITSPDPSRVLLSRDNVSAASASVTRTLVAGQRYTDAFYVHALANNGTVAVKVSAPGWTNGTLNMVLTDTAFSFSSVYSPFRAVVQKGPQTLSLGFAPVIPRNLPQGYSSTSGTIRTGAAPITVNVTTSNASALAVDNPRIVFSPLASNAQVTYRPVRPGTVTLALVPPAGYVADASLGSIQVNVEGAKLSTSSYQPLLGRDLQSAFLVMSEDQFSKGTTLTVTSSDPSRLLVSSSSTAAGAASTKVTVLPNGSPQFWAQALADNGTATVTISADGYQSTTLPVKLAPSAVVFNLWNGNSVNLKTTSTPQAYAVNLSTLDPATLKPTCCADGLRPGKTVSVSVSSSNTAVVKLDKSTVQFPVTTTPQVTVQPVGAGSAVVSLGVMPGGTAPASGGQILFNVTK